MRPIFLQNARILDPSCDMDEKGHILVVDGKIAGTGGGIAAPEAAVSIDLHGLWAAPGLIDMHVHLREPGEEYKETIETGTAAAAAGGFSAVACMPNTNPVNDSSAVTRFIIERARATGSAKVYPVAAVTKGLKGEELAEFQDLMLAGAIAFSDDGNPVSDPGMMRLALQYATGFGALLISHAEERGLSRGRFLNEGRVSTMLGLSGIPSAAEDIAVFRDVRLAEFVGARLHVAHVSTKGTVDIIREAKAKGVKVTAETAPHYFSLTEDAVIGYNTNAKMNPPLRREEDRLAIIEGLMDCTIDAIATDHAPHSRLEKEIEFELAANGIIGLETAVPLALELFRQSFLSPLDVIRCLSSNPAGILRVKGGSLKAGGDADICVIDPEAEFSVTRENLRSRSCNTPFLGKVLKGRAVLTLLDGLPVHNLLGVVF